MLILDTTTLDERADKLSNSEIYWTYNALDCCVTYDVFNVIEPQLDEVTRETYRVSMATLGPVLEMMLEGLSVNLARRDEVRKHYESQLEKLERGFVRLCVEGLGLPPERKKRVGRSAIPVSWSSPDDVKFLFHTVLGIPEKKRRKKGQDEAKVTSDRATLEGFRSYFHAEPFVNFILALRDCAKAIGFLKTPLDPDSKIRCSFNVAGTDTGRLSSSFSDTGTGTNLQNVTGKLKDIFWAEPGQVLLDVDLEQGDSRGVGAIAWNWFVESHGEAFAGSYLDACESGDLHTTVTRMAWQDLAWGDDPKGFKAVAKQLAYRGLSYRDLSKKLGHGSNYMGQAHTMSMHTKLPVDVISEFQHNYFEAFPCIPTWQHETLRRLEADRCLITPFGRRRYFWGDVKNTNVRNAAIAYSPQSVTGEFCNRGAIALWHHRNRHRLPIRFLLQVHDSLVFSIPHKRIEELVPLILQRLKITLPLVRGRDFSIPHGAKLGWNYGAETPDNPYGLREWRGSDDRTPPKRPSSFHSMLRTPVSQLK